MIQFMVALRDNTVTLTVEREDQNEVMHFMCPTFEEARALSEMIVQRLRDQGVNMVHVEKEDVN